MHDKPRLKIDLVFEGGSAKGMVLVGALEVLVEAGYSPGRLLGTSAGAITALALAAGYTIPELNAALTEKDEKGKPVFASFLSNPPALSADAIRHNTIRKLLEALNISLLWDFFEDRLDDRIAHHLANTPWGPSSFVLKNKLRVGGQIAVAGSTKVTRLSEPWSTTRHQAFTIQSSR